MELIRGSEIAKEVLQQLQQNIEKSERPPKLVIFLVGDDPASHLYVRLKQKAAARVGIQTELFEFTQSDNEEDVVANIKECNEDDDVDAILVQLPLPNGFDTERIIQTLNPKKDVDGFAPENRERFFQNEEYVYPVFPAAIMSLVHGAKKDIEGKTAVVVGKSDIFDDVMCAALERDGANTTFVHCDKIEESQEDIASADILVTACGKAKCIRAEDLKDGVVIIDGGITTTPNGVLGDVDVSEAQGKPGYRSPVPYGVGPMTVAHLLRNVYQLATKT